MTPEVGVTVPPGDAEALAEAIIALLENEPRRQALGAAARTRALERYAWSRLAHRLLSIYKELTSPAVRRGSHSAEPALVLSAQSRRPPSASTPRDPA
jgi:colanic acid biosynthesis glycosyl transferase WcaI